MMDGLNEWVIGVVTGGGYWGIFALMVLENVIPPIPSELIMGLAGIAVARGQMEALPVMLVATAGSTLGNVAWFWLGRALGYERLRPLIDRWGRWLTVDWATVERAAAFLQRHGQWVVFAVRFSPVMRTMISLPAGMARMGWARFFVFTFAGATVWNAVLLGAGFWLGRNFSQIERFTGPVALATAALLVAGWLWRVLTWKPE